MIISASRRTDIPAFYAQWFMNRVHAGWCLVPNPLNSRQVSRVSLDPSDVDAIVFWSKNPSPLLPHLAELDGLGFRYYFQFSVNAYPPALEPNVPSLDDRVVTFRHLSGHVGPMRVVWRYDPIILSNRTPLEFHREQFATIAEALAGCTRRVVVSLVDFYRKTDRRLLALEHQGFVFERASGAEPSFLLLLKEFASVAAEHDMEIFTCAEERDYGELGIPPGCCIDHDLIQRLWPLHLKYKKDPTQRHCCLCMVSKDIGMNDTCLHGCPYCYATRNCVVAQRRYGEHDADSPMLWRSPDLKLEPAEVGQRQGRLFGV